MDQHIISSMMFCSSIKCLQGGCHASWLQNWKNDVLMPARKFWNLWSRRWWLSRNNCYWRWNLGPLPPAGNQESEQGMAPYLLTKIEKFRTQPSAGKVMLTLFWGERGVILEHYMPRGNTDQWNVADLLKNHLRPAIKSKRRGLLITGVLLQHDNAQPHTVRSTVAIIQDLSFECLPHLPYLPDLVPSDFHVFRRSKRRWQVSLSGLTKRCSRRCMSGCTLSQKTFFLKVSKHFRSTETLVWYAMKTT